jgi:hypothetical protein
VRVRISHRAPDNGLPPRRSCCALLHPKRTCNLHALVHAKKSEAIGTQPTYLLPDVEWGLKEPMLRYDPLAADFW